MSWLEVHIFGAYPFGEGIVLKFPDGRYAVVDCCNLGHDPDFSDNRIVTFLRQHGVTELAFACLTHPHEDHYRGLQQVLETAPPQVFFRSAAMQALDLMQIVKADFAAAGSDAARQKSVTALKSLFKIVKQLRIRQEVVALGTHLYPFIQSKNKSFAVNAFAPCGDEIAAYQSCLRRCFLPDGMPVGQVPSLQHNDISMGLRVECKKFSIVLGGDVTKRNWKNVVSHGLVDFSRPATALVKVAHHGSPTGDCEGLWEAIAKNNKPLAAVVTGWSNALPDWVTLQRIATHVENTYCTHERAITRNRDNRMATIFSGDRETMTLSEIGFTEIVREDNDNGVGRCSFLFEKDGTVDIDIQSPAIKVPI
jgi:beta-lactamase superfamily II metal-dependent hydrolase